MTAKKWIRRAGAMLAGAVLLMALAPLRAQEEAARDSEPKHVVKLLRAEPRDVNDLGSLLSAYGVSVNLSERIGLIAIGGPPAVVDRAEEAFKMLQAERTASRNVSHIENVEMTVHLLGIGEGEVSAIPAGPLRTVVEELKQTFPFKGYRLLETFVLRGRVGEDAGVSGTLVGNPALQDALIRYDFSCKLAKVQGDPKALQVSINNLNLVLRVPVPIPGNPSAFNYQDVAFRTAMEVPDGKIVVVGKAGAPGDSKGYLVVLTAKVVQ